MTKQEAAEQLYHWQKIGGTNFHAKLYELIAKADAGNRIRLSFAFPEEVTVWSEWYDSPSPEEFFARYGLPDA